MPDQMDRRDLLKIGAAGLGLAAVGAVGAVDIESGAIVAVFDTGGWPDGIGYSPLTR